MHAFSVLERGKSKCLDYMELELWKLHIGAVASLICALQSGSGTSEMSRRLGVYSGSQGVLPRLRRTLPRCLVSFSSGAWALSNGGNWPRLRARASNGADAQQSI